MKNTNYIMLQEFEKTSRETVASSCISAGCRKMPVKCIFFKKICAKKPIANFFVLIFIDVKEVSLKYP
jgi:hypothetical protein